MSNRKSCVRCGRQIDEFAKACPFCGWNQAAAPPAAEEAAATAYVPPPQRKWWANKILGVIAFVALVIIAFVVGTFIHGFEPSEVKAAQTKTATTTTAPAPTAMRSNVTLVPVSGSEGTEPIEQPITTAPATTPGQQPNDATALPSEQYSAAAARAKAQQEAEQKAKSSIIDPRTLTGSAYDQSQRAAAPGMASASAPTPPRAPKPRVASNDEGDSADAPLQPESAPPPMRTSAYLQYKPLPHIAVDHDITARLNLTVDADGHVTDIDVSEPVPDMPRLISAVQNWRFKPATENGTPVTSRVSVDITFRANE